MASPAVFLDRDGVLVRSNVEGGKPVAVRTLEELELLPGVPEAVGALRRAGFLTVVITNQPDVGKGLIRDSVVTAMHTQLRKLLPLDDIRVCPHRQDENCLCRKPKPGMLHDAAAALGIDLSESYMIGDRESDIVAGRKAGCYTILVDSGHEEVCVAEADDRASSLLDAAHLILMRRKESLVHFDRGED